MPYRILESHVEISLSAGGHLKISAMENLDTHIWQKWERKFKQN